MNRIRTMSLIAFAGMVLWLNSSLRAIQPAPTSLPDQPNVQVEMTEGESWGPLAGPQVRRAAPPGVPVPFGDVGFRAGAFRANLPMYIRILQAMEIPEEQAGTIQRIIADFRDQQRRYRQEHAEEFRELESILRPSDTDVPAMDMDRDREADRAARTRAENRLRRLRNQAPPVAPVLAKIWDALNKDQQTEFTARLREIANERRAERMERVNQMVTEELAEVSETLSEQDRRILERFKRQRQAMQQRERTNLSCPYTAEDIVFEEEVESADPEDAEAENAEDG